MDQKSDAEYRAEKLYKHSKEKFGYLIRETVSNAIHSTLIRAQKDKKSNYKPKVLAEFQIAEKVISITITDNGEGFTELNRKYFTCLDSRNRDKENLNLHPQGQGRLAILFFSDQARFESVFQDSSGDYKKEVFDYPDNGPSLFDIESSEGAKVDAKEPLTTLVMTISKQQTIKRAETFFRKYDDTEKLRNWFIENFFPFFMNNDSLTLEVSYNSKPFSLTKYFIENKINNIPFVVDFEGNSNSKKTFKLWLLKNGGERKARFRVSCFARQLLAELEIGKIEYEIDLPESYDWYLTSEFFDQHVDMMGDKIEISQEDVERIQESMSCALDKHFQAVIEGIRKETQESVKRVREKYHSVGIFIDEKTTNASKRVLDEKEIVSQAIENKGKVEKRYWTDQDTQPEDLEKLLNSSLHIYVKHRSRVLDELFELIKKYDVAGEPKPEIEDKVHDLFLKRGENLTSSEAINPRLPGSNCTQWLNNFHINRVSQVT